MVLVIPHHPHVGISIHIPEQEGATKRLYVNCNAGRVLRSLIIVKDGKSVLTQDLLDKVTKKLVSWNDLIRMGVIELVDANEEFFGKIIDFVIQPIHFSI